MTEEWRAVVGYEDYYSISNLGRVKRIKGGEGARVGHILKTSPYGGNYVNVDLCVNGKVKTLQVHVLVLEAFIGPKPTKHHECNHVDGNKLNNCSTNLEWATHKNNSIHRNRILGKAAGENHYKSRPCIVTSPDGDVYTVSALTVFCREKGLSSNKMSAVARGENKHHRHWKCQYV